MWSGQPAMFPKPFFWTLLLLTCGYAILRGGREERTAALACLAASIATQFVVAPLQLRYSQVEYGALGIDLAMLGLFTALALRSGRFWPLWVAGLQLTASMAHLLKAVQLDLLPHAYAAAIRFWAYPILLILVAATWRGNRRAEARLAA